MAEIIDLNSRRINKEGKGKISVSEGNRMAEVVSLPKKYGKDLVDEEMIFKFGYEAGLSSEFLNICIEAEKKILEETGEDRKEFFKNKIESYKSFLLGKYSSKEIEDLANNPESFPTFRENPEIALAFYRARLEKHNGRLAD